MDRKRVMRQCLIGLIVLIVIHLVSGLPSDGFWGSDFVYADEPIKSGQPIKYGDIVGVFSEDGKTRLDIGTDAMKKNVPATHESRATRLVIKRLDGESSGAIYEDHLVGIFSEDGKTRLDIGTDAMKKNVPATHESWSTRLFIMRLEGENSGDLSYGDIVGIFSEDGKTRLDIGTDAMKKNVPATHESWSTRLHIKDADPITDLEISSIEYDLENAQILSSGPADLYRQTLTNETSVEQKNYIMGSETVTESSGWSDSFGVKIGVKTEFKAKIPLLAEGKIGVSTELSNIYTRNASTSRAKKWEFKSPVNVPPHRVVVGLVSVTVSTIAVPYTLKGKFVRKSLRKVPVEVRGIYTGTNSHDLVVTYLEQDPVTSKITGTTEAIKPVER